jgi:hypothetical protein
MRAAKRERLRPGSAKRRAIRLETREHVALGLAIVDLEFARHNPNFCARKTTETKTAPLTSSFWNGKRSKLTAIAGLNPRDRESNRVLRPLWTELPAQTVRVYSL